MRVYGTFYGGSSYSVPSRIADLEEFASLKAAKKTLQNRASGFNHRFPCVDDDAEMHIFFEKPEGVDNDYLDAYPDRRLVCGPRGGVRMERC